tara:strand:- start:688 stop:1011 length:324 start_codon:yes stop_codon:yes gene_type:complete
MPKICREEDSLTTGHECTATSTLDVPTGNDSVKVEGKLVARVGDKTVVHTEKTGTDSNGDNICTNHTGSISAYSEPNVFVVGKAVARVGDAVDAGSMTSGASKVSVN